MSYSVKLAKNTANRKLTEMSIYPKKVNNLGIQLAKC